MAMMSPEDPIVKEGINVRMLSAIIGSVHFIKVRAKECMKSFE
jgi:hypothetical protein